MKIYYNLQEKEWFHTVDDSDYSFGIEKKPLSYKKKPIHSSIPFPVFCNEENNLGPLVGILTSLRKDKSIAGNGPLFKSIQIELMKHGGISVIFTPENVKENVIEGVTFLPETEQWSKIQIPLPHLVYNRVPFRKEEESESFRKALELFKQKNICFFNPSFLRKFEIYTLFRDHFPLHKYFPDTILINEMAQLHSFLKVHSKIYLKPNDSAKGKGIYRMLLEENGQITLIGFHVKKIYSDFQSFWENRHEFFRNKDYVAQKEITPALINDYRYDFRILAHFYKDTYEVTGIGIRQSHRRNLTTHTANGGELKPYEDIENKKHNEFIQGAVRECGIHLSKEKGFFGEFSIDAGITDEGKYVIYEINSKPMKFDEKNIEEKRTRNLCQLFFHLSRFSQTGMYDNL